MTRSHSIENLTILTKYLFNLGVRLTEFSVTVESVTLRFYCSVVKCYQNWSIKPCCKEESKPVKTGYFIIHKRNLLKCSLPFLPLDQSIVNDH